MPVSTPASRALGILTLVLGTRIKTPAKNSQVNIHDATSSNAEITGVIKLKWNTDCSVDDINTAIPPPQIIRMGRISSIAV